MQGSDGADGWYVNGTPDGSVIISIPRIIGIAFVFIRNFGRRFFKSVLINLIKNLKFISSLLLFKINQNYINKKIGLYYITLYNKALISY